MASDKTSTIRSLLLKAWRERMSDIQWGIHLKSVLPRGCSGDAYNLSGLVLEQAMISPIPNALMLSYLRHSLASQTISHGSLLEAISTSYADCAYLKSRPYCLSALLDLLKLTKTLISKRSKPEECPVLNGSLLKVLTWLLRFLLSVFEGSKAQGTQLDSITVENARKSYELALELYEDEFILNLLYVAKIEDKEAYGKLSGICKQIDALAASKTSPIPVELKAFYSSEAMINLRTLDPLKAEAKPISIAHQLPSFVHAIQPMLAFEALFHPTSDLTCLSQYMNSLSHILGNVAFSDMVHETLRSLLLTISQKEGLEPLKVDAFILVRLPTLLEKMYKLYKTQSGGDVTAPLKTPTELYKAFDKLLSNESLLDSIDLRCKCNIVEILLRIVSKSSTPLMTETEKDDVLKKRQSRIDATKEASKMSNLSDMIIGNMRNFELTWRAESTLDNVLSTFEHLDHTKPESVESLLGLLQNVIKCESFDMWQAVTSATSKLSNLIQFLLKFNQQSQESRGESVKNSCNRAALFDMTFLMLVYSAQCFGVNIIVEAGKVQKNDFMLKWITEFMLESPAINDNLDNLDTANVDSIMQQLANGELRTQVVKWQNVCFSIHLAMKEIVMAKKLMADDTLYKKMVSTMCSKLCALPVCVVAWMVNSRLIEGKNLVVDFAKTAENSANADVPYAKERVAMMSSILRKFMVQNGQEMESGVEEEFTYDPKTTLMLSTTQINRPLQDSLEDLWSHICSKGFVDIEAAWKLNFLYKSGGPHWFTSVLIENLLSISYQDDLQKQTELLGSVLHINLEQTTIALLMHVVPKYLQYKTNRDFLTDPHGSALAKLLVGALFTLLSNKEAVSRKRPLIPGSAQDLSDDAPSAKMRKLMAGAQETSSYSLPLKEPKKEQEFSPLTEAAGGFFKLLHAVISCQETHVTPVTHFAFRILEQVAIKGGKGRSRLILQHMSISLVMHLVKILPEMFNMPMVAKLFDVSTSSGRKNMARVMCLLRSVQVKQVQNCEQAKIDQKG